jgi:HK97 family phage major capsid protein
VPFLARCRPVEMGAPTHTVPALKQSGRNAPAGYSAADANIQVGYESELADLSENEDTAEFFGMVLRSRRLVAYLTAPNNLVADAPTGWADLVQHVRESIARKREHDYLFGDGVGVPLGVWKAPATITVPRAASGQIRLEDAAALIGSFLPMAYMKSMWLVHTKTLERIVTLKDASGASAFMDLSDAGGEGSPAGKFLNRPLFVSERAPLPGDRGDLALLAPSCYLAGVRKTNGQAVEIAVGTHQQFDEDVLQLKVKIRHDGQPQLSEPFRLADGSNTEVSPFVLLGA